jgi:phosphonatase-like hydrolase
MKPISLVVFDLAGTTVHDNQDVHRALQTALRKHGFDFSLATINPYMGIPKPQAIAQLLEHHAGQPELARDPAFIARAHTDFVAEMLDFYRHSPEVREKDGASEVFMVLKAKGIQVMVDTGFSRDITDALLARLGWLPQGLVDGSVTSDEVAQGRPHPDLIFRAMQLAGVTDAQQVAKVGDTASDLGEGTAAGCRYVIGITTGAYAREDLAREPHTHLVDSLPQVVDIVTA